MNFIEYSFLNMAFLRIFTISSLEEIFFVSKHLIFWKICPFSNIGPWQNLHIFRCRCASFAFSNLHLQANFFIYLYKRYWTGNFYPSLWTSITFLLSHLFSSLRSPGLLSNFLHGSILSWIVSKWDTVAVFNSNLSAIC